MIRRRDRNLHVVREQEDPTDRIVREILDELNSEDDFQNEMGEPGRRRKRSVKGKVTAVMIVLLAAAVGMYLLVNLQTYTRVRTTDVYGKGEAANIGYREFAGGVLKYSRDGISYIDQKGEEQWNHSYQIKNPYIEAEQESAVVADKGGNDILVICEDGVKEKFITELRIRKWGVSGKEIGVPV